MDAATEVEPLPVTIDPAIGLTSAQVAERTAGGQTNAFTADTSRSVWNIVSANVFTLFNAIVGGCFLVLLLLGRWQDALFGLAAFANAIIGCVQEFRAKAALDKLALLNAPRARVRRDGQELEIAPGEVVLDDILVLRAGDQVPADAVVADGRALQIDESMLTGESDAVDKTRADDGPLGLGRRGRRGGCAGHACGCGLVREQVRRRGEALLTRRIRAAQLDRPGPHVGRMGHRADRPARAQRADDGRGRLGAGLGERHVGAGGREHDRLSDGDDPARSRAGDLDRLRRRSGQARGQQGPRQRARRRGGARPGRCDLPGQDRHPHRRRHRIRRRAPAPDRIAWEETLAWYGAAPDANATARCLREPYAVGEPLAAHAYIPFSSARKWSAVSFAGGDGTWVLGAPEMVFGDAASDPPTNSAAR